MLIVKIGGSKNVNWEGLITDLLEISKDQKIILVHGANEARADLAEKLGHQIRYISSPSGNKGVYTDRGALDILSMAYAGLVNKQIVERLQKAGINAIGLSGIDGRIWEGERKKNILSVENGKTKLITDTYTGKVTKVNTDLLNLLLDSGYVPVLTQPAVSFEGEMINTDNDRNVAAMAGALGVSEIVLLFGAKGLMADIDDPNSLIKTVDSTDLDEMMKKFDGRISKKLMGAKEALANGVKTVFWGDCRVEKPITSALNGQGTVIS